MIAAWTHPAGVPAVNPCDRGQRTTDHGGWPRHRLALASPQYGWTTTGSMWQEGHGSQGTILGCPWITSPLVTPVGRKGGAPAVGSIRPILPGQGDLSERMSLHIEIILLHPRLVLAPTLEACPEATVTVEFQPVTTVDRPKMIFCIRSPDPDPFEEALDRDPTVDSWKVVDDIDGNRYYRVDVSDSTKLVAPGLLDRGVRFISAQTDGQGWRLTAIVPDQEALQDFQAYLRDMDIDYRLVRLHEAEHTTASATLTESQRETLIEAYRAGYFEVPRRGSLQDVANALGISQSAISQRLRRAWSRIVEAELLESQDA